MTQTLRMATPEDAAGMLTIDAKVVRETVVSVEHQPPDVGSWEKGLAPRTPATLPSDRRWAEVLVRT